MTKQASINYLNNSPVVTREPFTSAFTIETQQITSIARFRTAVKELGGWVDGQIKRHTIEGYRNAGNQTFLSLTADVPAAVRVAK